MIREFVRAVRQLARRPAFTLPALAGLALGIAATTAVFSVFSAMLLRSMGFGDSGRLVSVWMTDLPHGQRQVELSYDDWQRWQKARDTFAGVALASSVNLDFPLFSGAQPEHVDGTTVTGNFFNVLGVTPFAGRFFNDEDDRPGMPLRVVLSHKLWQTRFGADYGVIGRQCRLGTDSATVIGVARPEFDFPRDVGVWVPLRVAWPGIEQNSRIGVFRSVARLAPGVSLAQAEARVEVILRQGDRELPAGATRLGAHLTPIIDEIYGAARRAVWILLGAVIVVVLIGCANAANLLMARNAERSRETAIRRALGAGRGQVARLFVLESVALAIAAGIAGLALAKVGLSILIRMAPAELPSIEHATLDWGVLIFGGALTLATVVLFGVGPALLASKTDPHEALKAGGERSVGSGPHRSLRRVLIVGEVALSALLLVGAGLLARSFAKLAAIDPGFRPERVLTFRITTEKPNQESRRAMYTEVLERLRALPGVESAAAVLIRPLSGTVGWDTVYGAEGQSPAEQKSNPNGNYEAISPDYLRTMGIRLLAGRDFTAGDTNTAMGAVILNEATAKRHWPAGDAVGKRIHLGQDPKSPWLTVVGVAADVRYREWEAARPDFYVPYLQRAQHRSDFVVKTHGDPWLLAAAVRDAVFAIDRNQPISNVTTMDSLVSEALARSRFSAFALSTLASCALALAAIGIYGLLSYTVAQRTQEIGVRTALGASPLAIARLIAADGMRPVGIGLVIGLIAAGSTANVLGALLFGVAYLDLFTYVAASLALLLIAVIACAAPAWRASSMDPSRALR